MLAIAGCRRDAASPEPSHDKTPRDKPQSANAAEDSTSNAQLEHKLENDELGMVFV
ncbi:MAG TPA: hypothetical protein VH165_05135 [Kofleriaceae bacterium]|nr:hypothetical protein [Kofleriaceae bacterium]